MSSEEYKGFYYATNKRVEDLTNDELKDEIEAAETIAEDAEYNGYGIGTKESVRHRFALLERGRRQAGILEGMSIEEVAKLITLVS